MWGREAPLYFQHFVLNDPPSPIGLQWIWLFLDEKKLCESWLYTHYNIFKVFWGLMWHHKTDQFKHTIQCTPQSTSEHFQNYKKETLYILALTLIQSIVKDCTEFVNLCRICVKMYFFPTIVLLWVIKLKIWNYC